MAFKMTFEGEKLSIIMGSPPAPCVLDDEVVSEIFYEYYKGRVEEMEEREKTKTRIGFV